MSGVTLCGGVVPTRVCEPWPGPMAQLTITSALHDFGYGSVGSDGPVASFTIENEGTAASSALSTSRGGSGADSFEVV